MSRGRGAVGSDGSISSTRRHWCSSTRRQAKQHSAYRSPSVIIEYRWHPLHGKELHVCRRSGRGGTEMLEVEVSPGMSRKLPAWMCDANTCSSMSLGPAVVSTSALNELGVVLAAQLSNRPDGASSNSSGKEESLDATSNKRSVKATGTAPPGRFGIPAGSVRVGGATSSAGRSAAGGVWNTGKGARKRAGRRQ